LFRMYVTVAGVIHSRAWIPGQQKVYGNITHGLKNNMLCKHPRHPGTWNIATYGFLALSLPRNRLK
jgi:hypothetical protein